MATASFGLALMAHAFAMHWLLPGLNRRQLGDEYPADVGSYGSTGDRQGYQTDEAVGSRGVERQGDPARSIASRLAGRVTNKREVIGAVLNLHQNCSGVDQSTIEQRSYLSVIYRPCVQTQRNR